MWNCRVNWFWNVQIPRKKMVRARTGTIPLLPCCQWDRVMEKHGLVLFYLLHFGLQKNFLREKNLVWTLFWKACLFLNICWKSWNVCEKSKKRKRKPGCLLENVSSSISRKMCFGCFFCASLYVGFKKTIWTWCCTSLFFLFFSINWRMIWNKSFEKKRRKWVLYFFRKNA